MRYAQIDNSLFKDARENFAKRMRPNSVAIFFSNDMMPRGADSFHVFRQNPDLFYLSGADQEETILVLYPDAPDASWKEILFVRETNEHIAVWEGEKLTREKAREVSGIQNIQWSDKFKAMLPSLMFTAERCYLNMDEHLRYSSDADYAELRHIRELKNKYPLHTYERSAPIMHSLRSKKHPVEVALIQEACDITRKGFERLLKFIKPGVMEYEIQAELMHEFLRNRSRGFAYEPIIASGYNSNVLHYIQNDQEAKDGDIMLLDVGAEYAGYASDLSRTIPVNGRYTPRQKQVYNAVLRVMKQARELLRPGAILAEYHKSVGHMMEKELVDLGLITMDDIKKQDPAWPAYKKYFMHGTSHFLGIDVHDVGHWYTPIQEDMVFTCEPGIYIPAENLGIRIENDILVGKNGPIDLMENIPIEADHIEELMQAGK